MSLNLPEGFIPYATEWEAKINAFIELNMERGEVSPPAPALPAASPPLPPSTGGHPPVTPPEAAALVTGLPFAVKDNIAVKDFSLTCGSKLLEQFRSPYSAAIVQKIEAAGGTVIGKTNLDEFGMGSSTDNSALKKTNNPWDMERVPGGSSGGSAAAVAAGIVPYALGTDTGGSVRQPAAFCGVAGLKPTYGAVSRFGLVAYASSLECAGILSDTIERCRAVFALIKGRDTLDETTHDAPEAAPPLYPAAPHSVQKIGVLSAAAIAKALAAAAKDSGGSTLEIAAAASTLEPEVQHGFELAKERLAALGHTLVDVEIPSLKYGVPAYYTIAAAEASANLARFDSIRYGARPGWAENPEELIDKAREAGFGAEVKLRILLGTFVLRSGFQDRYYLRAQRIRAGIRRSFEALLGGSEYTEQAALDAILMPVFPSRAFGRGPSSLSAFAQKAADLYTCCANLAGLPALSFPASVEGGLPVGVQILGRAYAEGTLLNIAQGYEERHPFPHPAGFKAFWR
ncbi:MAG: Asp-tRNA(Asn)/Glu-tRNA(Gln) amidotransferase subunit GatA [Treponema sp.]|jgi:aspartyl-tRNA(Asn)/glutamyl-tRNA(Gln) amidotransferase subunit A|nr:Asp-tRNA(Asn)/Glu-tRNA(Gln) amidotransferase subunit GatA [Treponema sp.]